MTEKDGDDATAPGTRRPAQNLEPRAAEEGARRLPPAARRALAEAEQRRQAAQAAVGEKEIGGRGGLDPARYGDWEVKGIASDF